METGLNPSEGGDSLATTVQLAITAAAWLTGCTPGKAKDLVHPELLGRENKS